ncbi:hypothetical protein BCR33DRAFT_473303 [Rhizoclosmatium globosum]|uniref:Uncharacterized protein n=1 Tax=Rhizoclosmatium globosum TaxID=329046 RepID=A0A1Y2BQ89_9FUNG|nr:hypothetical protein BCR33DRAFT_473303 [Rhizoclosmatium globosum]|eukprot:ORY36886.1 hypothetical protein BCR33DRAFT_473303 [Rhizoclosmatium globosum]
MKVSAIVASLALASYAAAVALKPEWKNEKRDDTDFDTEVYADWIKKRDEAPLPEQTLEELVKDDVLKVGVLTQPIATNPGQQPTIEIQSDFLGVAVPVADGANPGSNVPNPVIPGKLKPAVPIPDTKISAAAPNLVTDDNFNITPYLTDCQFNLMLQITSFMEDSTQDYYGKFGFCKASSNNQGISAGFLEFTTCSGSLLQVCKKYNSLKPSNFCSKYLTIDGAGKTTGPLIDATKDKRCRTQPVKNHTSPEASNPSAPTGQRHPKTNTSSSPNSWSSKTHISIAQPKYSQNTTSKPHSRKAKPLIS